MNIPYTCKFCKHEGIVTIGDDYPVDMIHVEKWIPMICCPRCADYMESKRKLSDAIQRICFGISAARQTLEAEKAFEVEARMRDKLEKITKKFCTLVCGYHRKTSVWDVEFVNMLAERPDKWFNLVGHYIRGIANMPRQVVQASLPHND